MPEMVPWAGGTAMNKMDNILRLCGSGGQGGVGWGQVGWEGSHNQTNIRVMANGKSDQRKLKQGGSDRHFSLIRTASRASPRRCSVRGKAIFLSSPWSPAPWFPPGLDSLIISCPSYISHVGVFPKPNEHAEVCSFLRITTPP